MDKGIITKDELMERFRRWEGRLEDRHLFESHFSDFVPTWINQ